MKYLFSVLLLLLLVAAASAAPQQAAAASDPVSRFFFEFNREIQGITSPLSSACGSPAFTLYERVANPGSQANDHDHCIQFVAVQAGDTSQCAAIQRGAPKTKCYCLIASNKNDPAICDQVPATNDMQAYLKPDCLWEVAIRNNNPAACEAMGNQKISRMFIGEISRQTCLQRLASGQGVGASTL